MLLSQQRFGTGGGPSFYPQLIWEKGEWLFFHFEPTSQRGGSASPRHRFVRERNWKLYETGQLYDMSTDLDEELPIFESDDNSDQAAARARLKPVFAEMVA